MSKTSFAGIVSAVPREVPVSWTAYVRTLLGAPSHVEGLSNITAMLSVISTSAPI